MKKGSCRVETVDPVGIRIKELISEHSGVTELAQQLGVSAQTIYRWIYGNTRPSREKLEKLAKILHTSPETLLGAESANGLTLEQIANISVSRYSGTPWASYGKLKCYIDTHGGKLPPAPKRKRGTRRENR